MDTKTDRELIELAAKAAGAEWQSYSDRTPSHWSVKHIDGVWREWNPLIDDGDALRLAVDLNLTLSPIGGGESTGKAIGCRYEFTRRSIVMAAAKIGEGME